MRKKELKEEQEECEEHMIRTKIEKKTECIIKEQKREEEDKKLVEEEFN